MILHSKERELSIVLRNVYFRDLCAVKAAAQCHGSREKKTTSATPKTTSVPTNAPLSVSEPKTETKINNQLKIKKGQLKNFLMMVKAIFDGGRFIHGSVLSTVTLTLSHVFTFLCVACQLRIHPMG